MINANVMLKYSDECYDKLKEKCLEYIIPKIAKRIFKEATKGRIGLRYILKKKYSWFLEDVAQKLRFYNYLVNTSHKVFYYGEELYVIEIKWSKNGEI